MIASLRRVGTDDGNLTVWVIVGIDVAVGVGSGIDGSSLQAAVIDGDQ